MWNPLALDRKKYLFQFRRLERRQSSLCFTHSRSVGRSPLNRAGGKIWLIAGYRKQGYRDALNLFVAGLEQFLTKHIRVELFVDPAEITAEQ